MKRVLLLAFMLCLVLSAFPMAYASPGTVSVTHYLHYAASVGTVNTINTQGRIMNTTTSWSASTQTVSGETNTTGTNYVNWYFYVYPVLAGDLSINGAPAVTLYLKSNVSVTDLTLITTINKISNTGARTQISTKTTSSLSLGTSYQAVTNTHGTVTATVSSGYLLELNITLGGSTSANLTLTLAYDTSTYPSKMTIPCVDPVTITLSSDKSIYEWEQGATLTVTVKDVWGGYDVASAPTISFTTPTGLSYTTSASSTGESQYTNTYTYTITRLSDLAGAGDWKATASVSDRTGNSYTSSAYTFELRPPGGGETPKPEPYTIEPGAPDNTILIIAIIVIILILVLASGKKRRR